MLRLILAALGIVAAALLATGLGAFDSTTMVRAASDPITPTAPSIQIAPTSAALTFARFGADGRVIAVVTYDAGRVRGVALDAAMTPGEDAIDLVNRLGYEAVQAEIDRAAAIVEIDARDLGIPVDLVPGI